MYVFSSSGLLCTKGSTAPVVDLKTGGRVQLGPNSTAKFSGPQIVLEKGIGEVASSKGFEVEAKTLHVRPVEASSVARVEIRGEHQVLVAAYHAPVRVLSQSGVMVAYVPAGTTLSFEPQGGNNTSVSGCLLVKTGKFIVVDPTNPRVIAEVRGDGLGDQVGNQVSIGGTAIAGARSTINDVQVIGVTAGGLQKVADKTTACVNAAKAVGADVPPGPTGPVTTNTKNGPNGPKTGGSSSTPYIIGGIAVAGGAIGAIAATRGGKS